MRRHRGIGDIRAEHSQLSNKIVNIRLFNKATKHVTQELVTPKYFSSRGVFPANAAPERRE